MQRGGVLIPSGYYSDDIKITAKTLKEQTSATATASDIISGKTAYVNGNKVTGTLAVQSILSFSAAPSGDRTVIFTWKNPAKGAFSGVIIVYKTGGYPTSINDGTRIYKGAGNNSTAGGTSSVTCNVPTGGITYYFRAFSYAVKNNGEWIHTTTYTATATTLKSLYVFTSSGTFTIPLGVTKIDIFCVGGGGGGGAGRGNNMQNSGGGGGGGYTATKLNYAVTPGTVFPITVGAGGSGGPIGSGKGGTGGTSSFGSVLSAAGGEGGGSGIGYTRNTYRQYNDGGDGGDGGSGGGGGHGCQGNNIRGTAGGSDGGNGAAGSSSGDNTTAGYRGIGQKTTTRAFGESSNTLYAGGGGGGSVGFSLYVNNYGISYGPGGAGGGGNGNKNLANSPGLPGAANTGGGGGGSGTYENALEYCPPYVGGAGGSGVVLVRL